MLGHQEPAERGVPGAEVRGAADTERDRVRRVLASSEDPEGQC